MHVQALPLCYLHTIDGTAVWVNPWHVRAIMEIGFAPGKIGTRLQFANGDHLDFPIAVGKLIGQLADKATLIFASNH
jgi:hypothetical protein